MANETVSTDKNWTALAARSNGDVITVDSGATLTIDQTAFGAGNEADLKKSLELVAISGFSKVVMRNTSTSQALRLYGNGASGKKFRFENGCAWDIDGGYITIHTGTGAANQTTTGWTTVAGYDALDEPGCIEVQKQYWFELVTLSSYGIAEGDTYTNNSKTFTIRKVYPYPHDDTKVIVYFEITTGSGDPSSGSTTFTLATGSGSTFTSTWEYYFEAWANAASATLTTEVGINRLGQWFKYNNSTGVITFGDHGATNSGRGGNIPYSGAIVRVYNIGIGSAAAGVIAWHATKASNCTVDTDPGGVISWKRCYFFAVVTTVTKAKSVWVERVGQVYTAKFDTCVNPVYWRQTVGAQSRYTAVPPYYYLSNPNSFWLGCLFATKGQSSNAPSSGLGSDYSEGYDIFTTLIARTSAVSIMFHPVGIGSVYRDIDVAGGGQFRNDNVEDNIQVKNLRISDSFYNAENTDFNYAGYYVDVAGNYGILDGLEVIPDGWVPGTTYTAFIRFNGLVKNVNIPIISLAAFEANGSDLTVARVAGILCWNNVAGTSVAGKSRTTMQNVYQGGSIISLTGGVVQSGLMVKACDATLASIPTSLPGVLDSIFWHINTALSPDVGYLALTFCQQSADATFYSISGASIFFDGNGSLYFTAASGSIIYEWPYVILGVSSFVNTDPTLGGGSTGNVQIEYALDKLDGNGYGSYQTATGAHLSAESVSASNGFKLKIKITRPSGSDLTTYLNKLQIPMNSNRAIQYPIFTGTVTLRGMVSGSNYLVFKGTSFSWPKVIGSGVSGSSPVIIQDVPYDDGDQITVRVRKSVVGSGPDYVDYKAVSSMTYAAKGADITISQVLDLVTT